MIKEYKLFKTIKKTTRENNLFPVQYGTDILVDVSILADVPLNPDHRDAIIQNIQKYHIFHDRMTVFIVRYDRFTDYEVRATFANHNVFDAKTGKRLYVISQMTNVKVTQIAYKDIWESEKTITEYIQKTYFQEPITDIEI